MATLSEAAEAQEHLRGNKKEDTELYRQNRFIEGGSGVGIGLRGSLPGARGLVNNVGPYKDSGNRYIAPAFGYHVGKAPIANTPDLDSLDNPSPYILMPDDELIFGWQYPPSYNLTHQPGSTETYLNRMALSGSAKLHLYGSMIKEGKAYQHHNSLNQLLTSNAVHEVIGNDPVVDRFEIERREVYTGSYNDSIRQLIMSGAGTNLSSNRYGWGYACGFIETNYDSGTKNALDGKAFRLSGIRFVFDKNSSATEVIDGRSFRVGLSSISNDGGLQGMIVSAINGTNSPVKDKWYARAQGDGVSFCSKRQGSRFNGFGIFSGSISAGDTRKQKHWRRHYC